MHSTCRAFLSSAPLSLCLFSLNDNRMPKVSKRLSELFSSTELLVDQRLPKFKVSNIYDNKRTDTGAHKMEGGQRKAV
jgi:hypothetical protein